MGQSVAIAAVHSPSIALRTDPDRNFHAKELRSAYFEMALPQLYNLQALSLRQSKTNNAQVLYRLARQT
jgi:hypothetical protein